MKFTQLPITTFQEIQLNAGVLLSDFDPATAVLNKANIIGATSGGINFSAKPSYTDFGEDIDNCPKNTMELKVLDTWEVTMGGTFVSANTAMAERLLAAGDVDSTDSTKIVPRSDLTDADFSDLWWVGDYSKYNGSANGGYIAIKLINALSTDGFQIQSSDKAKGTFSFTFTGHYSIDNIDQVPFEIYIKAGTAEA